MSSSVRTSLVLVLLLCSSASAQSATDPVDLPSEAGGGAPAAASRNPSPVPPVMGEQIEVVGHYLNEVGTSDSASAGTYTSELIEDRPLLRPGEVLELVPGLIVTQHSGAGKANQFFLRGFNLDHGTDFATYVEGVPVNLPTHAHGQGYMDLNWLIPELISRADYWKGPYYAENGDFSSAGAERITTRASFPRCSSSERMARTTTPGLWRPSRPRLAAEGSFSPWRGRTRTAPGGRRCVLEGQRRAAMDARPGNGTLSLLGTGYWGQWNATNQVPQRAIDSGEIGRFGTLSPSDGGWSHRFNLSVGWEGEAAGGRLRAQVYAVNYGLDLFSNFTYFLDDPVNGDQMEQMERRWFEGTSGHWTWIRRSANVDVSWEAGWDARLDQIDPLGLFSTAERTRLAPVSLDKVFQANGALWGQVGTRFTPWFRALLGLRGTAYYFDVKSNNPLNSGTATAGLLLPKATLTFGPWARTELFANFGEGYHSNDARGITASVDSKSGEPISAGDRAGEIVRRGGRGQDRDSFHTSRARSTSGSSISSRSWSGTPTPAPPRPRLRRAGSAWSGRTATSRCRGCCSTSTSPGHRRSSPETTQPPGS